MLVTGVTEVSHLVSLVPQSWRSRDRLYRHSHSLLDLRPFPALSAHGLSRRSPRGEIVTTRGIPLGTPARFRPVFVVQHRDLTAHSLSFSLSLLLLILHRTDVCSPLLCLFPTQFRAKIDFSRKKKEKCLLCSHRHTTVIAGPTTCLIAHLLAPHDRAQSQHLSRRFFPLRHQLRVPSSCPESGLKWGFRNRGVGEIHPLPSYKLICTKEKSSLTNADSQKA